MLPNQQSEIADWYKTHCKYIAGVDEVGRGPLAGPVVAAAVVLDAQHGIVGLNDSKLLLPKKRLTLYRLIKKHAVSVGIHFIGQARIDEINILQASLEAMSHACMKAEKKSYRLTGVLIDGNKGLKLPKRIIQHKIVGGDRIFEPIMAASIVAKVVRDRFMGLLSARYPNYGFESHKGYATKGHFLALEKLGPSAVHRMSFQPVINAIK